MPILLEGAPCPTVGCDWTVGPRDEFCTLCGAAVPFVTVEPVASAGGGASPPLHVYKWVEPRRVWVHNRTLRRLDLSLTSDVLPAVDATIVLPPDGGHEVLLDPTGANAPTRGRLTIYDQFRTLDTELVVAEPPTLLLRLCNHPFGQGEASVVLDRGLPEFPLVVASERPLVITRLSTEGPLGRSAATGERVTVGPGNPWVVMLAVDPRVPFPDRQDTPFSAAVDVADIGCLTFRGSLRRLPFPRLQAVVKDPLVGARSVSRSRTDAVEITIRCTNRGEIPLVMVDVEFDDPSWLSLSDPPSVLGQRLEPEQSLDVVVVVALNRVPDDPMLRGRATFIYTDESLEAKTVTTQTIAVERREPRTLVQPLCIDFGTTATCLVYPDPAARDELGFTTVSLHGSDQVPTVLRVADARDPSAPRLEIVATSELDEAGRSFPHTLALHFKPQLDQDLPQTFLDPAGNPVRLTPSELVTHYLRRLLAEFSRGTGYLPRTVVLTAPAVFGPHQRRALRAAAQRALGPDVEVVDGPSEPVALLISYIWDAFVRSRRQLPMNPYVVAVLDVGGGTTDTAICRVTQPDPAQYRLEVLRAGGKPQVGGEWQTFDLCRAVHDAAAAVYPDVAATPFPESMSATSRGGVDELVAWEHYMSLRGPVRRLKHREDPSLDVLFESGAVAQSVAISTRGAHPVSRQLDPFLTREAFERATVPGLEEAVRDLARMAASLVVRGQLPPRIGSRASVLAIDAPRQQFRLGVASASGFDWMLEAPLASVGEIAKTIADLYTQKILAEPGLDTVIAGEYDDLPDELTERLRTWGTAFLQPFDHLVLCGNASRLGVDAGRPFLKELASRILFRCPLPEVDRYVEYHPSPKVGVAVGAWLWSRSDGAMQVEGVDGLVWDVGLLRALRFFPLFRAGTVAAACTPQIVRFSGLPPFVRDIPIYENRNYTDDAPLATAHSQLVKIGSIPLPPDRGARSFELQLWCELADDWYYVLRLENPDQTIGPAPIAVPEP